MNVYIEKGMQPADSLPVLNILDDMEKERPQMADDYVFVFYDGEVVRPQFIKNEAFKKWAIGTGTNIDELAQIIITCGGIDGIKKIIDNGGLTNEL